MTIEDRVKKTPPRSDAEMVMDYRALRAVIGGIAVSLVFVVYIGNWVIFTRHQGECFWPNPRIPGSLSGFYYTHMRNLFVGAMCAMGVFFVAYRGHDRWDNRFTNVAGLAAICIALSPTTPPYYSQSPKGGPNQFFSPSNLCGSVTPITYHQSSNQGLFHVVHEVSLVVLFLMVFLMVLVQFTRTKGLDGQDREDPAGGIRAWWNSLFSEGLRAWWKSMFPDEPPNPRKNRRNRVYVFCAGCIAISGVLALVSPIWPSVPLLLFAESGAFVFFGIAWYVKGAASAPLDHPALLVQALSRPSRRWLAD